MHRTEKDSIESNTDEKVSDEATASAHRKIDVDKLKELVSTISIEEFSKRCKTGVDGYFLARKRAVRESHQLGRLRTLENLTKVPMFRTHERVKGMNY